MYYLYGQDEVLKTIARLARPFIEKPIQNATDLETAFHSFLSSYQPSVPRPSFLGLHWIEDAETEAKLRDLYNTVSILNDRDQSKQLGDRIPEHERLVLQNVAKEALDRLGKLEPKIFQCFQLVIDSLFYRASTSASGGSTSNAVGVIWMNNRVHWNKQDLVEFLIHELTHNLFFIDELCHLHYRNYDEIAKEENYSLSAILHTRRPLDKVVHSMVVSIEILSARAFLLGEPAETHVHPPSPLLIQKLDRSLLELGNKESLLTERGNDVIPRIRKQLQLPDVQALH